MNYEQKKYTFNKYEQVEASSPFAGVAAPEPVSASVRLSAEEPIPSRRREAAGEEAQRRRSARTEQSESRPSTPSVQIGLIEVVVVAPQSPGGRAAQTPPAPSDLASRHYLRNL